MSNSNDYLDPITTVPQQEVPVAPVPENLTGATDRYELAEAEIILGGIRAWEVTSHQVNILGDFDAEHLARIHAYVVMDIYPIIGETRADTLLIDADEKRIAEKLAAETNTKSTFVASAIGATHRIGANGERLVLPAADTVNKRLAGISAYLKEANFLRGLPKQEFVDRLAEVYLYYVKTNAFEHGNGPVLVAAMGLLAERAGYKAELNRSTKLARATDAVLEGIDPAAALRLQYALSKVTSEDIQERRAIFRRITLQVVKPKFPQD